MCVSDHYFSSDPSAPDHRQERNVTIFDTTFTVTTSSGVFSHDRLDKGTAVLLKHAAPPPPSGFFVDLGCGWGPITLALAHSSPEATVLAVDVNERARELTALNAERNGLSNVTVLDPEAGLKLATENGIDVLWSNPPVRIGKANLHALMTNWLAPLQGYAELVMSKNLGADSFATWLRQTHAVERLASSAGFRILRVS